MRPMARALHVVLLGFRRRLHGLESSPNARVGASRACADSCARATIPVRPPRHVGECGTSPASARGLRSEQGSDRMPMRTADRLKPHTGQTCSYEVLDTRPVRALAVLGADGMEHRPGRFDGLMRRQTAERDQTTAGLSGRTRTPPVTSAGCSPLLQCRRPGHGRRVSASTADRLAGERRGRNGRPAVVPACS